VLIARIVMDKSIIMTAGDFIKINTLLLANSKMQMYAAKSRFDPIVPLMPSELPVPFSIRDIYTILIGNPIDGKKITGQIADTIRRNEKVGFISVQFHGEDDDAIAATHYGADGSDTAKIVGRELNKILKTHAHKGVSWGEKGDDSVDEGMYWTDAALESGKNWHMWFGFASTAYKNKLPGAKPKTGS
jgi:hypothetical protein